MAVLLRLHEAARHTDIYKTFWKYCILEKNLKNRSVPLFLTNEHLLETVIRAIFKENKRCPFYLLEDPKDNFKKMVKNVIAGFNPHESETIISTDCLQAIYEKLVLDYYDCIYFLFYFIYFFFRSLFNGAEWQEFQILSRVFE